MARDILQHDNGIVDDESRGNGQRHQGQVVEAVAEQVHDAKCGDERDWNDNGRYQRGPNVPKECKYDHNYEADRNHESSLHFAQGCANSGRAVVCDSHIDSGRD